MKFLPNNIHIIFLILLSSFLIGWSFGDVRVGIGIMSMALLVISVLAGLASIIISLEKEK